MEMEREELRDAPMTEPTPEQQAADEGRVGRLAEWLWDNCAEDEHSGLLADDPRRIAAVALRWPELRRLAGEAQQDEVGARSVPLATSCAYCGHRFDEHNSSGCWVGNREVRSGCSAFVLGQKPAPIDPRNILGIDVDETAREARQDRCPSCDHKAEYHAADDGKCWFTVDHGTPGSNLVCPCAPRRDHSEARQAPRPRCPHCQMPHDLTPGSLPVAACTSIRDRIAEALHVHLACTADIRLTEAEMDAMMAEGTPVEVTVPGEDLRESLTAALTDYPVALWTAENLVARVWRVIRPELEWLRRQLAEATAVPSVCPTRCDPDCTDPCHEAHAIPRKRDHDPADCPSSAPDAGLREQYAAAIEYALLPPVPGRERRRLMAEQAADAVLAVRDREMQQLRAERDMLGRETDRLRRDWVALRDRAEKAEAD
jgi:hypothetical protein